MQEDVVLVVVHVLVAVHALVHVPQQQRNKSKSRLGLYRSSFLNLKGEYMKILMTVKDLNVDLNNKKILNLNNRTIDIYIEDKIALIGKNGAGKTTLINCLLNEMNHSGVIDRER